MTPAWRMSALIRATSSRGDHQGEFFWSFVCVHIFLLVRQIIVQKKIVHSTKCLLNNIVPEKLCPVFFLKQVLVFRSFSSIGSVGGPFSTCEGVVGANTQTRTDEKLLTLVAIFSLLNSNFSLVSLSCFVIFSIAAVL